MLPLSEQELPYMNTLSLHLSACVALGGVREPRRKVCLITKHMRRDTALLPAELISRSQHQSLCGGNQLESKETIEKVASNLYNIYMHIL